MRNIALERKIKQMLQQEIRGLYAITPEMSETVNLVTMTQQALTGGARLIQYRNKTADHFLQLKQAYLLANLCRKFNALFIVNDYLDLAIQIDANGVHLGCGDITIAEARQKLGPGKIIGASAYNLIESAIEAEQQGADYIAFGAFFTSTTKPDAATTSVDLLYEAKQRLRIPIVVIGGITPNNALELVHLGAAAVAVSSALFGAPDIRSTADKFSKLFKRADD